VGLRKNGRYEDAVLEYKKALELEPDNKTAHLYITLAYIYTNQLKEAGEHADKAKSLGGRLPPAVEEKLVPYRAKKA